MKTEITKEEFEKIFGPVSQETWNWIRARNRKATPMKLRLMYYVPDNGSVWDTVVIDPSNEYLDWLIPQHPDVIFFYTTDTTDIWEEDVVHGFTPYETGTACPADMDGAKIKISADRDKVTCKDCLEDI